MSDHKESRGAPMFRRLFVTVSNNEFVAFLNKARGEQWIDGDNRVDIEGIMGKLVRAYSEGRIVFRNAHEVEEERKVLAKKAAEARNLYGKDH